jgi:hypothetical protein
MCIYVHENMWLVTDTYIEDEREKWTLIITDIFIHLVSRWSPLILTVLTNQFIKIVNVTQSFLVQSEAEGVFSPRCILLLLIELNSWSAVRKREPAGCSPGWFYCPEVQKMFS